MNRSAKSPLPGIAEVRHLAHHGDLRSIEAIDLRPGHVIAREIDENCDRFKPEWPAAITPREPDTRSDTEVIAALKNFQITDEGRAHAAENEAARRVLLKARTRLRRAKAAARRRAAAPAPKPKPAPKPEPKAAAPTMGSRLWWLRGRTR